MRILVFSDSHGYGRDMKEAMLDHPEADVVVFLGDGERNFDELSSLLEGKQVYKVQGNNDFYTSSPKSRVITVNGINVYLTHGHYEYVKSGLSSLLSTVRSNNCTIGLYGHTHVQQRDYVDGTYLFNPGAVLAGNYGIVDITDNGIICIGAKVKY